MTRNRADCDTPAPYTRRTFIPLKGSTPGPACFASAAICVKTSNDCESSLTVPASVRSSDAYRVGLHCFRPRPAVGPGSAPLTPTRWTDAPTHAQPLRTEKSPLLDHSVSMSWPAVTFCQSTTTTPVNRLGSAGLRTTILVVYGIVPIGVELVIGLAGFDENRMAVPETKYSCPT